MAGALRELIELLLTEIAVSGTDGTPLSEIWGLIEAFYSNRSSYAGHDHSSPGFFLDRSLQEDLWEWLTLNPEVSVGRNKEYNGLSLPEAEAINSKSSELRLFVSEERIWKALTGHEKDETKVPSTEFSLLSIIASCRSQGILQTELVRRSGQDARSVPKRTDALKTKGYIDKRQVQAKSAKTSLCTLSRFANVDVGIVCQEGKSAQSREVIDFGAFCHDIFRILKKYQIIARSDLRDELGFHDIWRRRILNRAIRKLETIGCVQRVKARSQFHDTMQSLHSCVLLVREPTQVDLKLFKSDYKTILAATDQENEEMEEQAEMHTPDHKLIQWVPDANFANLIATLIKNSGTRGSSNAEIIREGFGKVFRRPSENTLNRITECWQLSQPLHLRSSAIVRDTALNGTVTHYVHYSYSNFKQLVDTGCADWDAVSFRPRDVKSSKLAIPPPDALPVTDQDGLVPFRPSRRGIAECDHYCAVSSKSLGNYAVTKSDPVAMTNENMDFVAVFPRESDGFPGYKPIHKRTDTHTVAKKEQIDSARSQQDFRGENMVETPGYAQMTKAEKIEVELKKGERSPREVFAAFGLDESWTHVAVRLMERNAPGVYMTAKGKARPAGRRQGRPKESRIAVFRSSTLVEYLKSIPQAVMDVSRPLVSRASPCNAGRESSIITTPGDLISETNSNNEQGALEPAPVATETQSNKENNIVPRPASTEPQPTSPELPSVIPDLPEIEKVVSLEAEERSTTSTAITGITISRNNTLESCPSVHPVSNVPSAAADESSVVGQGHDSPPESPVIFTKSRRLDHGGSVARLRRAIIMDIIKQAGGAFPSGSEIWHAFSTVWMKYLKHAEKPDSRTVRNVVKYLIDTGKLRQITFSGKGPKGLMVTRSIVMTPETSPSSPLVTKMQKALLESNYYVPDNVEIDSDITRIVRGATGAPTGVYTKSIPIDPGMTVNLRTKPASVIALERRKEQSIHKRLSKPIRLMGIKRKGRLQTSEGITSFSRPVSKGILKHHHEPSQPEKDPSGESTPMEIDVLPSVTPKRHLRRESLDQPRSEVKRRKRSYTESQYDRFLDSLEDVLQWEFSNLLMSETEQGSSIIPKFTEDDMDFIHHTVNEGFEQAPVVGSIRFAGEKRTRPAPLSAPSLRRRRHKSSVAFESKLRPITPRQSHDTGHESGSQPWLVSYAQQPMDAELYMQPNGSDLLQPSSPIDEDELHGYPEKNTATMARRRRRGLKALSNSMIERLKHAIVVVRTIAGGTQGRIVDWDFVTKAFPREDPQDIRSNGKLLLNRDRRQLAQMQDEFRVKLLAEYKKKNSSIPIINFNNMASYDWDAAVTWATAQYYSPFTRNVPLLPASRARLIQDIPHRIEQVSDEFEMIYTTNPTFSITKRESLFASRPYLSKQKIESANVRDQNDDKQAVKCWILSNIVAKEATYNAIDARDKLSRLPNVIIEDAVKELIRERFISQSNRGRVVPGRNFTFTDNFQLTFGRRRAIDSDILRQAAKFKRMLDDDFKRDGVSQLKYDASDGAVLAVMALAAQGRVHILPNDPPANPFGLTEGNYETRTLDKAIFKFQVDVIPDSSRYQYGYPLAVKANERQPPIEEEELKQLLSGNDDKGPVAKLPLWLDINGNVHVQLWEAIVSAIVGILAIRPKIDIVNLHEQLQNYLAPWDIERILRWLEKIGLAENEGGAGDKGIWSAKEYWWMIWA
ncbi:TFIIIC transcription initiation factor complex subunits Tfc3, putative [Talaromyces stipitatus ATCC 10500]|uniref:TFIIIC transcription initiation factor complex subunits Tfc3, putative n=1 Tax=Talaromyces stipitatus (strain ATCC 10500 / CBS 375.48 / QM 6759 / NRRL 1006) TaxID=441959 RepID=B8MQY7_TALSN|nr:TFIIIC transcription initiation factor complex subunits Tfc3, putative [Talaromyces stipitatus ATCC 10500]EED12822.1 TFIIIC transcription initiation factor complex subunits Tfc3, putative [Talaromyces stipitatus ATCC 10500]